MLDFGTVVRETMEDPFVSVWDVEVSVLAAAAVVASVEEEEEEEEEEEAPVVGAFEIHFV